MTKRAVTYARVSSNDKAKTGGENLSDQTRLCKEYALRQGYTIVAELAEDDRGASGATFDLPELNRAIEMARNGAYDVLIVRELDRLSRDLAKQMVVEQTLTQAKVKIEYVLYDFPDTPEGRLNKNLRAMLAEYEREKITQRMARGRQRTVRNGNVLTNHRPPFGYREVIHRGNRTLEIAEEEAQTVRLIFQWYTSGDATHKPMSIRGIARRLSELGIPSCLDLRRHIHGLEKNVRGYGQWGCSSVSAILTNETYAGVWRFGKGQDNPIEVQVPAIINRKMWDKAQNIKQQNQAFSDRNLKYEYLLGKRLYCRICGRKIHGKRKTAHHLYYYCGARRFNLPCDARGGFRVDKVDAVVWNWIVGIITNEESLLNNLHHYQSQQKELTQPLRDRLNVVNDLICDNEGQQERLLDLYLSGDFPKDILVERRSRIDHTLSALYEERARLTAQIEEKEFSEDRFQAILEFSRSIREEVQQIDEANDFQAKRRIITMLDVTGELAIEGNEKVIYVHCVIDDERLVIESTSPRRGDSPTSR